jgi:hypothetical protein
MGRRRVGVFVGWIVIHGQIMSNAGRRAKRERAKKAEEPHVNEARAHRVPSANTRVVNSKHDDNQRIINNTLMPWRTRCMSCWFPISTPTM